MRLMNCNVVDVRTGEVIADRTIDIADGVIAEISDSRAGNGGDVVDVAGGFVLPGLITCHAHLSAVYPFASGDPGESAAAAAFRAGKRARDALYAGVTTLRCVGESNRVDIYLKEAELAGLVSAPRILAAGRMLSVTGGHGHSFFGETADGADQWLAAGRRELHLGADHIKICITGGIAEPGENLQKSQMTDDEVAAAVRAASEHETYVVAHAAASTPIMRAIELGVRSFEHGYEMNDECVAVMAENGVFYGATLSVTRLPDFMRWQGFTEWQIERSQVASPRHLESFQRAVDAGVTLVNSTDYAPGAPCAGTRVVIHEIELMVEGGATPLQAVQATTVNAAELCQVSDEVGQVAEGYVADLVVLSENPVEKISAMRGIRTVLHRGELVRHDG